MNDEEKQESEVRVRLAVLEIKIDTIMKAFWGLIAFGALFLGDKILNLIGG